MTNDAAGWPGAAFLQITARTNPCSRHLWGTLARAVASICAHRARLQKLIVWLLGVYILEACAVICRKATLRFSMLISSLPGANSRFPEHKIGVFVLFWPSGPPFSGFSSTKSGFLCQNWQFFSGFCPSRAQKVVFCARGWSSGKHLRDYGSRFFVISVPNGVRSVPNGVQSMHNCIVFFKKSPEEKII